jgi:hypothetical protein
MILLRDNNLKGRYSLEYLHDVIHLLANVGLFESHDVNLMVVRESSLTTLPRDLSLHIGNELFIGEIGIGEQIHLGHNTVVTALTVEHTDRCSG